MEIIITFILFVIVFIIFFEFRIRKLDCLVLKESKDIVVKRRNKIYPRHFSLIIPNTLYNLTQDVTTDVEGKIAIQVRFVISVIPDLSNLQALVRVGGWNKSAVPNAAKELNMMANTLIREYCEVNTLEGLTVKGLAEYLKNRLKDLSKTVGLEVISINILTIDPIDSKISDAIRQKEAARIFEQTESGIQQARISAAKAKTDAEKQIAEYEHSLMLKKLELKKQAEEKEAELFQLRVEKELSLKRERFDLERQELEVLVQHPELLLLTPQVAQLAEASQNLKNAKTVVSLSPKDLSDSSTFVGIIHTLMQRLTHSLEEKDKNVLSVTTKP